MEITEGRYIDLIEVDAASRTKVEDTRELLENVQYMPSRGRFKIYLIDEVHMLSGHSFNALLKTLEEPPEHVKFVFATTDPQKLPVTILSRCLQFNLKRLSLDLIESHLSFLIKNENISSDTESLKLIARAADGSMRDALSLLDQAIAYGAGVLELEGITNMLGLLPADRMALLVRSAYEGNGEQLMLAIEDMATLTPDFEAAADGLISFLHQIAIYQATPRIKVDSEHISSLANTLSPEDIQLYYQIALHGRRDLALAVDYRSGFEMMLLRMMTFRPATTHDMPLPSIPSTEPKKKRTEVLTADTKTVSKEQFIEATQVREPEPIIEPELINPEPIADIVKSEIIDIPTSVKAIVPNNEPIIETVKTIKPELISSEPITTAEVIEPEIVKPKPIKPIVDIVETSDTPVPGEAIKSTNTVKNTDSDIWHEVVDKLELEGMNLQLARHCTIGSQDDKNITLLLDKVAQQLYSHFAEERIQAALQQYYHSSIKLTIETAETTTETPDQRTQRKQEERQSAAEYALYNDPFVLELQDKLAAKIVPNSIKLQ